MSLYQLPQLTSPTNSTKSPRHKLRPVSRIRTDLAELAAGTHNHNASLMRAPGRQSQMDMREDSSNDEDMPADWSQSSASQSTESTDKDSSTDEEVIMGKKTAVENKREEREDMFFAAMHLDNTGRQWLLKRLKKDKVIAEEEKWVGKKACVGQFICPCSRCFGRTVQVYDSLI